MIYPKAKCPGKRGSVRDDSRKYLPKHIFGYYSGSNDRLQRHFTKHQERYYREAIRPGRSRALPLRPLFYAQLVHSQFVLLSFFVEKDQQTTNFLRDYLGIVGLESVLFVVKRPNWARDKRRRDRFWGARGVVRDFLDRLYDLSTAPAESAGDTSSDRLFLFLKDDAALQTL